MDAIADTLAEIARRLEPRDLGRLSCVSKFCNVQCRLELSRRYSERPLGKLVHAHGDVFVNATFQDILLVRTSSDMLVGRIRGQLRRIPRPAFLPESIRDWVSQLDSTMAVGFGSDGDLLLFLWDSAAMACAIYSPRQRVWSPPVSPPPEVLDIIWSADYPHSVYFRGAVYMCGEEKEKMNGVRRRLGYAILRFDLQRMEWSKVGRIDLSDDPFITVVAYLVVVLGRLLFVGVIADVDELGEVEESERYILYELHDGGEVVVEVTNSSAYSQMLKAAKSHSAVEFWGSEDDQLVFWRSGRAKHVFAYSIVYDRCFSAPACDSCTRSCFHYTDVGNSFVHFNNLPLM